MDAGLCHKSKIILKITRIYKMMRLNGVRRDLLAKNSGKTVSDTAMEWGFYHLGRFSEQYMKMFDELPSKTNQRGE